MLSCEVQLLFLLDFCELTLFSLKFPEIILTCIRRQEGTGISGKVGKAWILRPKKKIIRYELRDDDDLRI